MGEGRSGGAEAVAAAWGRCTSRVHFVLQGSRTGDDERRFRKKNSPVGLKKKEAALVSFSLVFAQKKNVY